MLALFIVLPAIADTFKLKYRTLHSTVPIWKQFFTPRSKWSN